jgi:hypothetical protein
MASDRIRRNRSKERVVVLDSSAAMMPFEFMIDLEIELTRILGNFKMVVPSSVHDELVFLSKEGKGRKKRLSKPALDLIKEYKKIKTVKNADDSVLNLALKLDAIVFTNDKELRKRAKENNLKTIFLRGKQKLVLE